ncbi:hypothetical protein Tco_1307211 [Tanacetum coccineum]
MRVEESLNVRFDESLPPKSSPLIDDDIIESQIIENQIEDIEIKENEPLNKEIVNIKETKDHPLDSVIVIMEYLVKISKKARILELKRRNMKVTVLTSYTSYPSRKI